MYNHLMLSTSESLCLSRIQVRLAVESVDADALSSMLDPQVFWADTIILKRVGNIVCLMIDDIAHNFPIHPPLESSLQSSPLRDLVHTARTRNNPHLLSKALLKIPLPQFLDDASTPKYPLSLACLHADDAGVPLSSLSPDGLIWINVTSPHLAPSGSYPSLGAPLSSNLPLPLRLASAYSALHLLSSPQPWHLTTPTTTQLTSPASLPTKDSTSSSTLVDSSACGPLHWRCMCGESVMPTDMELFSVQNTLSLIVEWLLQYYGRFMQNNNHFGEDNSFMRNDNHKSVPSQTASDSGANVDSTCVDTHTTHSVTDTVTASAARATVLFLFQDFPTLDDIDHAQLLPWRCLPVALHNTQDALVRVFKHMLAHARKIPVRVSLSSMVQVSTRDVSSAGSELMSAEELLSLLHALWPLRAHITLARINNTATATSTSGTLMNTHSHDANVSSGAGKPLRPTVMFNYVCGDSGGASGDATAVSTPMTVNPDANTNTHIQAHSTSPDSSASPLPSAIPPTHAVLARGLCLPSAPTTPHCRCTRPRPQPWLCGLCGNVNASSSPICIAPTQKKWAQPTLTFVDALSSGAPVSMCKLGCGMVAETPSHTFSLNARTRAAGGRSHAHANPETSAACTVCLCPLQHTAVQGLPVCESALCTAVLKCGNNSTSTSMSQSVSPLSLHDIIDVDVTAGHPSISPAKSERMELGGPLSSALPSLPSSLPASLPGVPFLSPSSSILRVALAALCRLASQLASAPSSTLSNTLSLGLAQIPVLYDLKEPLPAKLLDGRLCPRSCSEGDGSAVEIPTAATSSTSTLPSVAHHLASFSPVLLHVYALLTAHTHGPIPASTPTHTATGTNPPASTNLPASTDIQLHTQAHSSSSACVAPSSSCSPYAACLSLALPHLYPLSADPSRSLPSARARINCSLYQSTTQLAGILTHPKMGLVYIALVARVLAVLVRTIFKIKYGNVEHSGFCGSQYADGKITDPSGLHAYDLHLALTTDCASALPTDCVADFGRVSVSVLELLPSPLAAALVDVLYGDSPLAHTLHTQSHTLHTYMQAQARARAEPKAQIGGDITSTSNGNHSAGAAASLGVNTSVAAGASGGAQWRYRPLAAPPCRTLALLRTGERMQAAYALAQAGPYAGTHARACAGADAASAPSSRSASICSSSCSYPSSSPSASVLSVMRAYLAAVTHTASVGDGALPCGSRDLTYSLSAITNNTHTTSTTTAVSSVPVPRDDGWLPPSLRSLRPPVAPHADDASLQRLLLRRARVRTELLAARIGATYAVAGTLAHTVTHRYCAILPVTIPTSSPPSTSTSAPYSPSCSSSFTSSPCSPSTTPPLLFPVTAHTCPPHSSFLPPPLDQYIHLSLARELTRATVRVTIPALTDAVRTLLKLRTAKTQSLKIAATAFKYRRDTLTTEFKKKLHDYVSPSLILMAKNTVSSVDALIVAATAEQAAPDSASTLLSLVLPHIPPLSSLRTLISLSQLFEMTTNNNIRVIIDEDENGKADGSPYKLDDKKSDKDDVAQLAGMDAVISTLGASGAPLFANMHTSSSPVLTLITALLSAIATHCPQAYIQLHTQRTHETSAPTTCSATISDQKKSHPERVSMRLEVRGLLPHAHHALSQPVAVALAQAERDGLPPNLAMLAALECGLHTILLAASPALPDSAYPVATSTSITAPTSTSTSTSTAALRLIPSTASAFSPHLPFPSCFLYAPFSGPAAELHLLPPHSRDYAFVQTHFLKQYRRVHAPTSTLTAGSTAGPGSAIGHVVGDVSKRVPTILSIRYVVNPYLWAAHTAFEDAVTAKRSKKNCNDIHCRKKNCCTKNVNVSWGFHGTHRGYIHAIASRGMRREVTVKTAYGYGTYLARDSSYSADYSSIDTTLSPLVVGPNDAARWTNQKEYTQEASRIHPRQRHMFLCRVVLGKAQVGCGDVIVPLPDTECLIGGCNGVEKLLETPAEAPIWVSQHDAQVYPLYVITFVSPEDMDVE